jgi:flagellar biogenesis protein FliO
LEQAVTRKPTISSRSTRAKNLDTGRMATPKKTSKLATRATSIGKRRLVKAKAIATSNASAERTIDVEEIMPSPEAGLEGCLGLDSTMSPEMSCEAQAIVPSILDEKEICAREKESEVPTNLAETQQSAERRSAILRWLAGAWDWARALGSRQSRKRLRVCETVSLGEKRFVAVIEIDGEQFLVGGAASSVATLARLEPSQQFSDVLRRRWAQDPVQA